MRHRRHVLDGANFDTGSGQGADSGLASGAGARDANFDRAQTVLSRQVGGAHRGLLRREGSAFARSAEAERARTLPRNGAALAIGDGDDGVIEGGLNVHDAMRHVLLLLLLERLLLAFFLRSRCGSGGCCDWFSHLFLLGLRGGSASPLRLARAVRRVPSAHPSYFLVLSFKLSVVSGFSFLEKLEWSN